MNYLLYEKINYTQGVLNKYRNFKSLFAIKCWVFFIHQLYGTSGGCKEMILFTNKFIKFSFLKCSNPFSKEFFFYFVGNLQFLLLRKRIRKGGHIK